MKMGVRFVWMMTVFWMAFAPSLSAASQPDDCSVAMRVFKADPAQLIPEVKLVANVFNSTIGYQTKGYALIAIN